MGLINLWKKGKLYRLYQKARKHPEVLKESEYWYETLKTGWEIKEIREEIKEMFDWLKGYKTYVIAVLTATVTLLHGLGYIDEEMFKTLLGLLGAGAITTVASKINRIEQNAIKREEVIKSALDNKNKF